MKIKTVEFTKKLPLAVNPIVLFRIFVKTAAT